MSSSGKQKQPDILSFTQALKDKKNIVLKSFIVPIQVLPSKGNTCFTESRVLQPKRFQISIGHCPVNNLV